MLVMMMMHGVVVECIFAEDCCEMMGCVVMATWWFAYDVRGVSRLLVVSWFDFGGYLRTFTSSEAYLYLS
jgi:hypothetical protein